jgi:recombinational DNA repair ATPase RecF
MVVFFSQAMAAVRRRRGLMKFTQCQVYNYRNIHDSGPIKVNEMTAFVGQNESGKSNLFEALYRVNPFDASATLQHRRRLAH